MIEPVKDWPPNPGHYATRLVKGGPRVAVRIWFGLPIVDGDELDRSLRWCVEIDGKTDKVVKDPESGERCTVPLEPTAVWPFCAKEPITSAEYRYLLAMSKHAKAHNPMHPAAAPREKIDVGRMAPIF